MTSTFEDALAKAQSEMVAVALEYIGGRAETIYLFALSAGGAKSFDVFYRIAGDVYQTHKVDDANVGGAPLDTSVQRQIALQKFGLGQLNDLEQAAAGSGRPMPTLIKAVFEVSRGSLASDIRYDDFYSASNRSPDEFFQDWFAEEAAKSA